MASDSPDSSRKVRAKTGIVVSLVSLTMLLCVVEISGFLWERRAAQGELGWTLVASRRMKPEPRGDKAHPYFVLNPPTHPAAYFPLSEESPVWDELWSTIREIRDACQKLEADFILVLFPTAFQHHSPGHPDLPQRVMRRLAAADDVGWVDLLPVFKDACEKAGPGACDGYRNYLFADVWVHPNARGHRYAAESILEVLSGYERRHAGFRTGASSIDFAN